MLLIKSEKDFRNSTDEELNNCEFKILHQLTSKTDGSRPPFVFLVAFKTSFSSISSSTTLGRGVARIVLEGGSKSSKMSATMVDRRRKFWVAERLKR